MKRIHRRDFLCQAAGGLATAAGMLAAPWQPRAAAAPRTNIIFILADNLGYGDVGCYGQDKIRTPNIDRLAREGMRFTDAYAGCSLCAPSRSVLMTGYHMGHTPIRANGVGSLLPEETTVAEVLKKAGYVTGCFGKWGLGEELDTPGIPTRKGFDQFFGFLNQSHAHSYYPEFLYQNEREYRLAGNENGRRTTYSHDAIAGKALDFIRANKSKPFFCYVPFTIPHPELLAPEDSLAEYQGKFEERVFEKKGYAKQQEAHATYAAMITRMDRDVGRIMVLLKELKIDRNTVVFLTSDNGPLPLSDGDQYFHSSGPLRGGIWDLYEGGIRVPMIASWPGHIPAGVVSDLPWGFQDFMPTAAELAGATAPRDTDGISIVPTLVTAQAADRKQQKHQFLYWELPNLDPKNRWAYAKEIAPQALRVGEWKAVRPLANGPLELYNLKEDIGETRNLARDHARVLAQIEEYLKTVRTEPRPPIPFTDRWRTDPTLLLR